MIRDIIYVLKYNYYLLIKQYRYTAIVLIMYPDILCYKSYL